MGTLWLKNDFLFKMKFLLKIGAKKIIKKNIENKIRINKKK